MLLGVSPRRVQQLTREGVIQGEMAKGKRGRLYDVCETIQAYIKHVTTKQVVSQNSKKGLEEARIAKLELERRVLETKVKIQEGAVHTSQDVEVVMNDMLGAFKTRLWGLPREVAPMLEGAHDRKEIATILMTEIKALCGMLAEYHPKDFYARNPNYMGVALDGETDSDEKPNTG